MIPLKYQTSSQKRVIGQIISTDGNTITSSATTIANTDIKLWKFNSTALVNKSTSGATYLSDGVWSVTFSSDDADTLGTLEVFTHISSGLVTKDIFNVLPENEYNKYTSTIYPNVNTFSLSSNSISSATISSGAISSLSFSAGAISSAALSSGAISTLTISTAAWDQSANSVWTAPRDSYVSTTTMGYTQSTLFTMSSNSYSSGWLSSLAFGLNAITTAAISSGAISTLQISSAAWDRAAAAVWTAARASYVSTLTMGYTQSTLYTMSSLSYSSGWLSSLAFGLSAISSAALGTGAISTLTISTAAWDLGADVVWGDSTRTLSTASNIAADVWSYSTRALSSASYDTIVDAVWDEARSGHVSTLSIGYTQSTLYSFTASMSTVDYDSISNVVWDEARADHVSTLSMGYTQSTLYTISAGAISTTDYDNISNNVWGNSTRTLTAGAAISTADYDKISSAVWTRTVRDLSAGAISSLTFSSGAISTLTISTAAWDNGSYAVWANSTKLLSSAAAVWADTTRSLTDRSSFALSTIAQTAVSNEVWNNSTKTLSSGAVVWTAATRTLTDYSSAVLSTAGRDAIADAIWDELRAGHVSTLSMGYVQSTLYSVPASISTINYDEISSVTWARTIRTLSTTQSFDITGNLSGSVGSVTDRSSFALSTINQDAISNTVWANSTKRLSTAQSFDVTGNITGNISGSIGSVTDRSSFTLSTTALDSIYTPFIESTENVKDTLKVIRAVSAGVSSGGGSTQVKFYNPSTTVARVTADVSTLNNRDTVVVDVS
jgi:hypothetical protein